MFGPRQLSSDTRHGDDGSQMDVVVERSGRGGDDAKGEAWEGMEKENVQKGNRGRQRVDRSLGNGAGLSPGVSLCQNEGRDPPILFCDFTVHACSWPCDAVMKRALSFKYDELLVRGR